jgi:hypothetical protein
MAEHAASGVIPEFYIESVHNPDRSAREGRAVFDDIEHVRVTILGDRTTSGVSFVATEKYRKRWPDQYAAFKRGEEQAKTGTPLEQWPMMTKSRVLELKAVGIDNVESLAAVTDTNIGIIGLGGRELREQAKAFLDAANGTADVTGMATEIARLKAQVERLQSAGEGDAPKPRAKSKAA